MIDIPNIQQYDGQQVVLTSDRLVFVSKNDEHILFNSAGVVHMTSTLGIYFDIGNDNDTDQEKQFLINAPKIQLGIDVAGRTVEPITKGDALVEVLKDLLDAIDAYSDMVTASVPKYLPSLQQSSKALKLKTKLIRTKLDTDGFVKSDISYTI
jgi:hypothetical protein